MRVKKKSQATIAKLKKEGKKVLRSKTYRENERVKDKAHRKEKRQDEGYRENESLANKEYMKKAREIEEYRKKEQILDRTYRKEKRQDEEYRQNESLANKEYMKKAREIEEYRKKEQILDRTYRNEKRQDEGYRENESLANKEYMKKAREIEEYRKKEQILDRTYRNEKRQDEGYRENESLANKEYMKKAREIEEYRKKEQILDRTYRKEKRQDEEYRQNESLANKEYMKKAREIEEYRKKEQILDRTYRNEKRQDEGYRENESLANKEYMKKAREIEEYRKKEQILDRTYRSEKRQDEGYRENESLANKEYMKKAREIEEYRKKEQILDRTYRKEKRQDEEHREKEKMIDVMLHRKKRSSVIKRLEENEINRKTKEAKRLSREVQKLEKNADRLRKREARMNGAYVFREDLITNLKQRLKDESNKNTSEAKFLKAQLDFIKEIREVMCCVCCCCEALLFKKSVVVLSISTSLKSFNKNTKLDKIISQEAFIKKFVGFTSEYICKTCNDNIRSGKIPLYHPLCGLKPEEDVEEAVTVLSDLEERFITPILVLMVIRELQPFLLNPQLGAKGAVINIPVDIVEMAQVLPRKFDDVSVIQIKLKRHMDHKSDYMFETISPSKIMRALSILVKKPLYIENNITIDEEAIKNYNPSDPDTFVNFIVHKEDKEELENADKIVTLSETCNVEETIYSQNLETNGLEDSLKSFNVAVINNNEHADLSQNLNKLLETVDDYHADNDDGLTDKQLQQINQIEEEWREILNKTDEDFYLNMQDIENLDKLEEVYNEEKDYPEHDMNCNEVLVRKDFNLIQFQKILDKEINTNANENDTDIKIIAPGQGKRPVPETNYGHYDELAFPTVYGGQKLTYNREEISYTKRIKYELLHRLRLNARPIIVLFKAKMKIEKSMGSAIQTALRKVCKTNDMTVKDVRGPYMKKKLCDNNFAFQFMNNVRTSPGYAQRAGKRGLAMIRQLGLPTIFYTITANEPSAPELIRQLHKNKINNPRNRLTDKRPLSILEALQLPKEQAARLIREDPIACAQYYQNRSRAFLKYVSSVNGPFRENHAINHLSRREYQMRGSPHDHGMLYLKGAPIADLETGKNFDEVVAFIDKNLTCEYQEGNPNMMQFHIHKCNATCYKGRKNKQSCRFNFPKFISPKTIILKPLPKDKRTNEMKNNFIKMKTQMDIYRKSRELESFDDMLKKLDLTEIQYFDALKCSIDKPTIFYRRRTNEVSVNTYNKVIVDTWEGNTDMQYVLEPYAAIKYLFEYCFKTESGMVATMQDAVKQCKEGDLSLKERLRKISNAFINSSLISAQQAADECLGHSMVAFSLGEKFINTNVPEKRIVMRKSEKELKVMDESDTDFAREEYIDQYRTRPGNLNNVCLADFAAWYTKSKSSVRLKNYDGNESEEEVDSDVSQLKAGNLYDHDKYFVGKNPLTLMTDNSTVCYRKRNNARIIRYCSFKKDRDPVNFYREQIMLFLPWRDEQNELIDVNCQKIYMCKMDIIFNKYKQYNKISDEELNELRQQAERDRLEYEKEETEEFLKDELPEDHRIDIFEKLGIGDKNIRKGSKKEEYHISAKPRVDPDELLKMAQNLNEKQRELCMHILHSFKVGKGNEKVFLQGSAGTGKSFFINTLYQLMTHYFDHLCGGEKGEIKVLLTAPTGIAASHIDGMTCHSAFSLPTRKSFFNSRIPLNADTANTIRIAMRHVKIIVIDEVSMVSSYMFYQINYRCQQIFGNDESFGGKCVILVGDFLQLPPVLAPVIFEEPKSNDPEIFFQSFVWNEFKFFEFTEVMRQTNKDFITALTNCAYSKMTNKDVELIEKRVVKEEDVPKDAVRLYYTNKDVNAFNNQIIEKTAGELFVVKAVDRLANKTLPKLKRDDILKRYRNQNIVESNVVYELHVKIGIKYMVVWNIKSDDHLVNGTVGILEYITFNAKDNKSPDVLWINFDHVKIGRKRRADTKEFMIKNKIPLHCVPIWKETSTITSCQIREIHEAFRYQFPLKPAESMSIHKAQGSTLKKVCVDFTKQSQYLTASLKYVALSRCDYEGLFILGKFSKPLKYKDKDNKCIIEINRLRVESQLILSYYNFESKKGKSIIYHNVNSYRKHKNDILNDAWYWKSDIIILAEANVITIDDCNLPANFKVLYPIQENNIKQQRYKGLIILAKSQIEIQNLSTSQIVDGVTNETKHKWHIDLRTFYIDNHFVITGYKSPHTPTSIFQDELQKRVNNSSEDYFTTIIGDFNFNAMKKNILTKTMEHYFNQLPINTSTTDANTQIDVVFSTSTNGFGGIRSSYFSDHSSVFYQTEKFIKTTGEVEKEIFERQPSNKQIKSGNRKKRKSNILIREEFVTLQEKCKAQKICFTLEKTTGKRLVSPTKQPSNKRIRSSLIQSFDENEYLDNTIRRVLIGSNFCNVYNLCPYNSFIHGLLTHLKIDNTFLQYAMNSNNDFINLLIKLRNIHSKKQKLIALIEYCYEKFPNKFLNSSCTYNMSGDVGEVIQDLMKDLLSYNLKYNCVNETCIIGERNSQSEIIFINVTSEKIDNFEDLIINTIIDNHKKCGSCQRNTDINVTFGDFVILRINKQAILNEVPEYHNEVVFDLSESLQITPIARRDAVNPVFEQLTLEHIPNNLRLNNNLYFFKFLIHFIPPTQPNGIGHYICYYKINNNNFVKIDDVPLNNKAQYIEKSTVVNPVIIVYSKFNHPS